MKTANMRQGPKIKAFRKVKRDSSSGVLREKNDGMKLMATSRPSADRNECDDRSQTKKKSLGLRRRKAEKAKGFSNLSSSEKAEETSSVASSQERKSPQTTLRNKVIHTVITRKAMESHKTENKFHTIVNPPMKFANTRPRIDSGIVPRTSYPGPRFGIQNYGKRRSPRTLSPEVNKISVKSDEMYQRRNIGDYLGDKQSSFEALKKVDTLVTALAAMIPPCGSKSQLDLVVGSFASALKDKVNISWNQQKRDKNSQRTELGDFNMQQWSQRNSMNNNSTVMNPTEAWVSRCKGNAAGQRRIPLISSTDSTRPGKFMPRALVPQTPIVARRYGSTKIHEVDSDDSTEKNKSNYGTKEGLNMMNKGRKPLR